MESKKVDALLVAIDKGSLTSAAEELGYTQSGLTHMMNSLEDELGLNLLIRSKQGVQLSAAGQALLPELRSFTCAAGKLEERARLIKEQSYSTLRLGAYSSISRQWLPSILMNFQQKCPDMEVAITMSSITDTYRAVKDDSLDCAIVSYQASLMQNLSWIPLRDDQLLAIVPGDDGAKDVFPLEDFSGRDFLMPSQGFELDISPLFAASKGRIAPNIKYTNLDDAAIASMVAHGLGVSILSELVMQGINEQVRTIPLSPPAHRKLGIIVTQQHYNDRSIKRLVRCAQETVNLMYAGRN